MSAELIPQVVAMVVPRPANLSRKDVAAELRVSLSSVERRIRDGELRAFKVGHLWRISRSDLDAYVEANRAAQRKTTGERSE